MNRSSISTFTQDCAGRRTNSRLDVHSNDMRDDEAQGQGAEEPMVVASDEVAVGEPAKPAHAAVEEPHQHYHCSRMGGGGGKCGGAVSWLEEEEMGTRSSGGIRYRNSLGLCTRQVPVDPQLSETTGTRIRHTSTRRLQLLSGGCNYALAGDCKKNKTKTKTNLANTCYS